MDKKQTQPFELSHIYAPSPTTERGRTTITDIHTQSNRMVYCSSNVVIIRDLQNPTSSVKVFSQHKANTTCAKFSPSGNYICSGDKDGFVMIWNAIGDNLIVKKKWDYALINGPIRDITWTGDNERIAVVGEGQKIFGKVFAADTGSSIGEITGISKNLLSVSFKPNRPFRLVTAGEEFSLQFFEGPPFKFTKCQKPHNSFVNSVRYSQNGEKFISAGSDKKLFLFDGKSGDQIKEITHPNSHQAGIYDIDWFENSNSFVTCSGDKTVKLWNLLDEQSLKTLIPAQNQQIEHQQVSVNVCKDNVYSISLNGDLNVWLNASNLNENSTPDQVHHGHSNTINNLLFLQKNGFLVSSDLDGRIIFWNKNHQSIICQGQKHESGIVKISLSKNEKFIYSICNSQKFNQINIDNLKYGEQKQLEGKPLDLQASKQDDNIVYILLNNQINVLNNNEVVDKIEFQHQSTIFDVNHDDSMFAIGDNKGFVLIIKRNGEQVTSLEHYGQKITSVCFSHSNKFLICGDCSHKIRIWDLENYQSLTEKLVYHTAMIYSLRFSENDNYFISSSLDNRAIVWDTKSFNKCLDLEWIHKKGMNCAIFGQDGNNIYTCGGDNIINLFKTQQEFK